MTTILAYTSPALGHLYPISAQLNVLRRRGYDIALRTLRAGVVTSQQLGFATKPIDPRIEAIELDDWQAKNPRDAIRLACKAFCSRAAYEVDDLRQAITEVRPDALLIDANCWGAAAVADAGEKPWLSFWPYTPFLRSRGVPPFGPGLRPWPGLLGRIRDEALRPLVVRVFEGAMLEPLNRIRADAGAPVVNSADEFLRRSPLILVAGGEPFEYPHPDWGDAVQMIGNCDFEPATDPEPEWLAKIDRPIVLAATSSEPQHDAQLVYTAIEALADEPVHVVATMPAGGAADVAAAPNATVREFVPHGMVLDRAVCAITHGGMGVTQKALARGVPVCAVPFGRDQFEVARRVEVSGSGTRLPAKRLTAKRLRKKVRKAMTMTEGARRVASGFTATGGVAHGADLIEQRLLSKTAHPRPAAANSFTKDA